MSLYRKGITKNSCFKEETVDSMNQIKLPDEYQRVEYIQSTGTQYINTGIKPCMNKTRCVCDISPMNENDTAFFGSRGTYYLFYNVSGNYFWPTSKCETIEGTLLVGDKYHVDWNKGTLVVTGANGVYQRAVRSNNTEDSLSMYIFNFNPIDSRSTQAKLYYFDIYYEDAIVRKFIPCYRKKDSEVGLYDVINNVFYTNCGTGVFFKGPDYTIKLPNEYQRVEYIESSGTQYINTGVIPNETTVMQLGFRNLEATGNLIVGYRDSTGDDFDFRFFNHENKIYYDYGNKRIYGNTCSANIDYYFELGNFYVKDLISGNTLLTGNKIAVFEGVNTIKINLMESNNSISKNRIYFFKIYNNNILIRDFIPCYRKSDNVIGLYDIVNNVFYTNVGTGTFTKGSDCNFYTYRKLEYIESTGTQYINTEVVATSNVKIVVDYKNGNTTGTWVIGGRTAYQTSDSIGIHIANNDNYSILNSTSKAILSDTTLRHKIEVSGTSIIIDDINLGTYTNSIANGTYPIYIFTMNSGNVIDDRRGIGKLYSCKIYNGNALLRDFIPAIRELDNEVGLYDKITDTFYTNIGTGVFTGKELNRVSKLDSNNILYTDNFYEI